MSNAVHKLLDRASKEYYNGSPVMSDAEFDALQLSYNYEALGADQADSTVTHLFKMYSLTKVYDEEKYPLHSKGELWHETDKLDGAAVELTYIDGTLAVAATRGDGTIGQDITSKMLLLVPNTIEQKGSVQIVGEVVVKDKSIENSRNYASGALNLKDLEEFKTRIPNLDFIAYSVQAVDYLLTESYYEDMIVLRSNGFLVVTLLPLEHKYPTDGKVFRLGSNPQFYALGYTARHPRGAYARKLSSDVEIKETQLLEVIWGVGGSGKVTPVGIFTEVVIDDAKITRATLHNPGFIEDMGLCIGDTILVSRSGGVIPKILGKVN